MVEALDVAAGVSFLIAGVAAWTLSRRSAVLLVEGGLAWFQVLVMASNDVLLSAPAVNHFVEQVATLSGGTALRLSRKGH